MEIREIQATGPLRATVSVPGSKSYTQRALVIAALAEGRSILRNGLRSQDTEYLIRALRSLGAVISEQGCDLLVEGTGGRIRNPGSVLFLGNNGTAMRFLAGLVCLGTGFYTLTGDARLCERPLRPLLNALSHLGAEYRCRGRDGCAPFEIRASSLSGGKVLFRGIESSQYVSSLLLSAPYAREDIILEVSGTMLSRPYIDMTIQSMGLFGVRVAEEQPNRFSVPSGRAYRGREYVVEADASSASYFFLAAALCGGSVEVANQKLLSCHGDIRFLDILQDAGCTVIRKQDSVEVRGGTLTPGDMAIPMGDMPDMVPTVAALAACRPGHTDIEGVPHLRFKESDRLAALAAELAKTGVRVMERPDGLSIEGGIPRGAEIETYNDHRIAMSFAVLGLVAPGMRIRNPDCVKKSFPGFWGKLEALYP
jgi:3-phosphoshikimate 1-carboxyvinyltransferase